MAKENEIVIYVRKDQINVSIINRMGQARMLIPSSGFKLREEDVTHDFVKQKELHQTPNAANEYPLFQYHKDKENIYHIGNLEALKAFLTSPPPSVLSLHDSDVEVQDIDLLLPEDNNNNSINNNNIEKKEECEERLSKEEEEEKEPSLGLISQSLQTVEGVVKYSTSWLTSWFYSAPTVAPLSSSDTLSPSSDSLSNNIAIDNNSKVEVKVESRSEESEIANVNNPLIENKDDIKDFKVVQTNWYWRQQNRVIRFDLNNKTMYRYDPLDLTIRAIHPFSTLKDITCYNSQYFFQLTFYKSETDPTLVYEYYSSSSSDYPLILSLLTDHSSVAPNVLP